MNILYKEEQLDSLLFQASGSMKLLRVWMERVAMQTIHTWNNHLNEELCNLCIVVVDAKKNLNRVTSVYRESAASQSFCDKMQELLKKIDTKEMIIIQSICVSIQNQIDYIVNDLDKKRRSLYEIVN